MLVQHACAAFTDGSHRQLRLERHTQLPHHDDVQGCVQRRGDFEGDGNAAAGQSEDHDVLAAKVFEALAQPPPRFNPVLENAHRQPFAV